MGFFGKKATVRAEGQWLSVFVPNAQGGRLWRTALDQFPTAAIEVHEKQGAFALTMTTSRGAEDIAAFATRREADCALRSIACALAHHKSGWRKLMRWIVILLAIFGFMSLFGGSSEKSVRAPDRGASSSVTRPSVKPGVPVPADELFGK